MVPLQWVAHIIGNKDAPDIGGTPRGGKGVFGNVTPSLGTASVKHDVILLLPSISSLSPFSYRFAKLRTTSVQRASTVPTHTAVRPTAAHTMDTARTDFTVTWAWEPARRESDSVKRTTMANAPRRPFACAANAREKSAGGTKTARGTRASVSGLVSVRSTGSGVTPSMTARMATGFVWRVNRFALSNYDLIFFRCFLRWSPV